LLVDGFHGIADPLRRDLLRRLALGPARVVDLAAAYEVTRPAISRHLRILAEAGLATAEDRGRERHYRLVPDGLLPMRRFAEELDELVEQPARPRLGEHVLDGLDTEVRRTRRDHRAAARPDAAKEHTA
jgi:DNA-binding transcriptional ArsR family regulator